MKQPFAAEARTRMARCAMVQVRAFVALIAPWLAQPADRRMSRLVLFAIVVVLALGLGTAGYLAIEAVSFGIGRMRQDALS